METAETMPVEVDGVSEHPVLNFMRTFVTEVKRPEGVLQSWEVEQYLDRGLGRQLTKFVSWLGKVWYEASAGNALTDKQFRREVKSVRRQGSRWLRHTPTGLMESFPGGGSEFKIRCHLKAKVGGLLDNWIDAGSPISALADYQEQVMEQARNELFRQTE